MENEITKKIVYIVFETHDDEDCPEDNYADPVAIFHNLEDAKSFLHKYENGRKGCTESILTISSSMIFDNFEDFENNVYFDEEEMMFMCKETGEYTSYGGYDIPFHDNIEFVQNEELQAAIKENADYLEKYITQKNTNERKFNEKKEEYVNKLTDMIISGASTEEIKAVIKESKDYIETYINKKNTKEE